MYHIAVTGASETNIMGSGAVTITAAGTTDTLVDGTLYEAQNLGNSALRVLETAGSVATSGLDGWAYVEPFESFRFETSDNLWVVCNDRDAVSILSIREPPS